MSVTKKYTKGSKHVPGSEKCRVTFKLSKELAKEHQAIKARLAGTFNDWGRGEEQDEMKVLKDGSFSVTVTLPAHQEYLFKYVIENANGEVWVVDDDETVERRTIDYFENSYLSTEIK